MLRTMTKIISPRRIALLAVCFCILLASLLVAGCSKRESVTVQVDVAKSVDVWNMARSPGANVRVAASGFTMVAGMDEVLRKAINTDEFRALAICKHLAQRDDPQQTRLLDALAEMCAWSVRETPAAVRVTVTGSDTKEATAIANLVGRTLSEAAMVTAAANLATRREIEYQTLARLETKARDMESTVRRIESLGKSDGTTDTLATRTASEQARVFSSHQGRRVVLATNVAETSLTVPGIRYVIDAGLDIP